MTVGKAPAPTGGGKGILQAGALQHVQLAAVDVGQVSQCDVGTQHAQVLQAMVGGAWRAVRDSTVTAPFAGEIAERKIGHCAVGSPAGKNAFAKYRENVA